MWIPAETIVSVRGRLRLEPFRLEFAERLFHALDDAEHWRLRPDPRPRGAEDWRDRIGKRVREGADGSRIAMAVFLAETGECVGTTGYLDIQPENRCLEIGATIVSTKWQRTFVNTEGKLTLLRRAFEQFGAVRVSFKVDTRNERSMNAVRRIGGVPEGVLRRSRINHDGFIRDTAVFSIVDAEWPRVRARLEGMLGEARAAP